MSHHHSQPEKWKPHKDWRVIAAAVLMLIAMVVYIMTLDEAVVPGPAPANPPATQPANEPTNP